MVIALAASTGNENGYTHTQIHNSQAFPAVHKNTLAYQHVQSNIDRIWADIHYTLNYSQSHSCLGLDN